MYGRDGGVRGRQLRALGHQVKLLSARKVKPFVSGNKNDAQDARAIWPAAVGFAWPLVTSEWTSSLTGRRASDRDEHLHLAAGERPGHRQPELGYTQIPYRFYR